MAEGVWPLACPDCAQRWDGVGMPPEFCERCGYLPGPPGTLPGGDVATAVVTPIADIFEKFGADPRPRHTSNGLTIDCPRCKAPVLVARPKRGQGADGASFTCFQRDGGCGYTVILEIEVGAA